MCRQPKLLFHLLHLCGAGVSGQISLLLTVDVILSEEMREEHERITARFCPTDGAIVCCWMTGNVNESGREQEGKPVQPVFNWNIYSHLDDLYFNVSKYLLQLRI